MFVAVGLQLHNGKQYNAASWLRGGLAHVLLKDLHIINIHS